MDNRAKLVSTLESIPDAFEVPKFEMPAPLATSDLVIPDAFEVPKFEMPAPLVTLDLMIPDAFEVPKFEMPTPLVTLDLMIPDAFEVPKFEMPTPLVTLDLVIPDAFEIPKFEMADPLVNRDIWALGAFDIPKNVGSHPDVLGRFDGQVTFEGLARCTRPLFADGYYSLAVEKSCVYVENLVKQLSGLSGKYGADLMKKAFSVHNPLIKLNAGETDSDRDEQRGYMELFAGLMAAARNPRAHSHDWVDPPEVALELITIANHLVRRISMGAVSRSVT